jgi:hypothetical protein
MHANHLLHLSLPLSVSQEDHRRLMCTLTLLAAALAPPQKMPLAQGSLSQVFTLTPEPVSHK